MGATVTMDNDTDPDVARQKGRWKTTVAAVDVNHQLKQSSQEFLRYT